MYDINKVGNPGLTSQELYFKGPLSRRMDSLERHQNRITTFAHVSCTYMLTRSKVSITDSVWFDVTRVFGIRDICYFKGTLARRNEFRNIKPGLPTSLMI